MWLSGWQNWGSTMWTCWSAGPVATVRSAGCCLVAFRHAWSDAHDSRSWLYHGPRRVPQQPRIDHCAASCVVGGLVLLVANRLELEGAVRDVEVPTEAFAEPVQHLTGAALADAGLVHDDMRGQHGYAAGDRPGVQVVDIDHSAYLA